MNPGAELAACRKPRKVSCAICATEFEAVDSKAKYCSNRCKQIDRNARKPKAVHEIPCRRCGVQILTDDKRLRYCSEDCRMLQKLLT